MLGAHGDHSQEDVVAARLVKAVGVVVRVRQSSGNGITLSSLIDPTEPTPRRTGVLTRKWPVRPGDRVGVPGRRLVRGGFALRPEHHGLPGRGGVQVQRRALCEDRRVREDPRLVVGRAALDGTCGGADTPPGREPLRSECLVPMSGLPRPATLRFVIWRGIGWEWASSLAPCLPGTGGHCPHGLRWRPTSARNCRAADRSATPDATRLHY